MDICGGVASSLAACELTRVARTPIDVAAAARQHAAYVDALRALGFAVIELPAATSSPRSHAASPRRRRRRARAQVREEGSVARVTAR